MHKDLRDWLQDVEKHGELKQIDGVDCDLEMSGIAEILAGEASVHNPVLLFDNVPGYKKGFRTLFGVLGSPWRVAKTLGLTQDEISRMSLLRN